MAITILPGQPYPLGATYDGMGTNFSVFSEVADRVELCLFDADGTETRVDLPENDAYCWHGYLPNMGPGQRYGFRVHGPYDPGQGLRCNPAKLLLDPYAKAVEGEVEWGEPLFNYRFADPEGSTNDDDSAPNMPKAVVTSPFFDWDNDRHPRTPWNESVVYEVHVKGFTQRHPGIPEELRGTYAGLAHPASIAYLKALGVTAVELLPVHQFVHDHRLVDAGLRNYWGYNSIAFLAPHNAYAARGQEGQQVQEFKQMVKTLHDAGIEVILDVVYNHTAEGNHMGPVLSLKGLDNAAYYRLVDDDRRLLLRHHRHRQQPQHAPSPRAAADHGLAALLGGRHARRRLPFRPGRGPGPPVPRRRPAVGLLRPHPAGPGGEPGQAHRRALGPGPRRLPGRQLPAPVVGVERQVPRHGPRLLAGGGPDPGRVRLPLHRQPRPLRVERPAAVGQRQLRHRPRRLHPGRPRLLQREAQRGQRRGQQRRREPQPVVELRRRGPHRRPRGPRAAGPPAAQLRGHPAAVPGHPHAPGGRRAGPDPAGQQQRLLPGQRDLVVRLGLDGRGHGGLHVPPHRPPPRPPHLPPPAVVPRPGPPRQGRGRRGLAAPDGTEMEDADWESGFAKSIAVYLNGDEMHSTDSLGHPVIDDSFLVVFNAHHEAGHLHPAPRALRHRVGGGGRHRRRPGGGGAVQGRRRVRRRRPQPGPAAGHRVRLGAANSGGDGRGRGRPGPARSRAPGTRSGG